jgi:hypothetical protein
MVGATVATLQLLQCNLPINYKPGCSKIHQNLLAKVGRSPLAYCAVMAVICQRSPQPLHKLPQSRKWKPSHRKIRRIWRASFYIDGCGTLRTVALRRPVFKQKKVSATISLSLNYCSISWHCPFKVIPFLNFGAVSSCGNHTVSQNRFQQSKTTYRQITVI